MRRTLSNLPHSARGQTAEPAALTPQAIYVSWDDALALHQAGADDSSAATVLRYLAE